MLNASSGGIDILEETAWRLEKDPWELFKEICEMSNIAPARMEMWWNGYAQEDWLAPIVQEACYKICLGTVFPEGS